MRHESRGLIILSRKKYPNKPSRSDHRLGANRRSRVQGFVEGRQRGKNSHFKFPSADHYQTPFPPRRQSDLKCRRREILARKRQLPKYDSASLKAPGDLDP